MGYKKSQSAKITEKWHNVHASQMPFLGSDFSIVASFLLKTITFQKSELLIYMLIEGSVIILQYVNLFIIWLINDISFDSQLSVKTLIFVVFCISTIISFLTSQMHLIQGKSINNIKTALNCLIVKKLLSSNWNDSLEKLKNNSSKTINLDIGVVQKCVFDALSMFWGFTDITISLLILYNFFGMYSFFAMIIFFLLLIINVVLTKKRQKVQHDFRKFTENRLKLLSDTFKVIKFIKMSALEEIFEQKINFARNNEVQELSKNLHWFSLQSVCRIVAPMLAIIGIFNICVYFEECALNPEKILIAISLIHSTSSRFMYLFNDFLDFSQSVNAVKIFASLWENLPDVCQLNEKEIKTTAGCISMRNCSFACHKTKNEIKLLSNIDFEIKAGELVVVNGGVGSGKSSLLSAIYGNFKLTKGKFNNSFSHIAYLPQVAWHRKGTWKDNIIFSRPFNKQEFKNVIKCCSLTDEIANQTTKITTEVPNVSGGQRARIALARAIYASKADLYLFDDTLSSLDKCTAKHIFASVIGPKGILQEKTRIFVTNSVEFFKEADKVFTMKDFKTSDGEIHEFDGTKMQESNKETSNISDKVYNVVKKERIQQTSHFCHTNEQNSTNILKMLSSKNLAVIIVSGIGIWFVKPAGFNKFDVTHIYFINSIIFVIITWRWMKRRVQVDDDDTWSGHLKLFKDIITFIDTKILNFSLKQCKKYFESIYTKLSIPEFRHNSNILYYLYEFNLMNFLFYLFLVLILNAGIDAALWMIILNNENQDDSIMFSVFVCFIKFKIHFILISVSQIVYVSGVCNASKTFHEKLTRSILYSPLQYFQTINSSTLMCIFSNDMEEVDNTIPDTLFNLMTNAFKLMVFFFTILKIYLEHSWKLLIIPFFLFFIVSYAAQRCQKYFILGKSKTIQHKKYEVWNDILALIDDTINGAIVIKSCGVQENYIQNLYDCFDEYTLLNSMELYCKRNFTLLMDFFTNFAILILLNTFVISQNTDDDKFKTNLGLLLTCSLSLTETIRQFSNEWTNLESGLASIKILKKFVNLPPEDGQEAILIKTGKSKRGEIHFKNFSFSYSCKSQLQLKNINCTIRSGQKIGIVGKTGAGKSSIFNAILRLFNGHIEGCISISDIPIYDISLKELRRKIGIIPQDPILITGSLRENLDLRNEHTDEKILKVLKALNFLKFSGKEKSFLDYQISPGSNNISHGENQLICVARALLNSHIEILLIDEGTAAVDQHNDLIVQQTIKKYFKNHTILTIAHRFETIEQCDSVIVINNGEIVELDTLKNLVKNENSYFKKLFPSSNCDENI